LEADAAATYSRCYVAGNDAVGYELRRMDRVPEPGAGSVYSPPSSSLYIMTVVLIGLDAGPVWTLCSLDVY
jgi:hypothetical protein